MVIIAYSSSKFMPSIDLMSAQYAGTDLSPEIVQGFISFPIHVSFQPVQQFPDDFVAVHYYSGARLHHVRSHQYIFYHILPRGYAAGTGDVDFDLWSYFAYPPQRILDSPGATVPGVSAVHDGRFLLDIHHQAGHPVKYGHTLNADLFKTFCQGYGRSNHRADLRYNRQRYSFANKSYSCKYRLFHSLPTECDGPVRAGSIEFQRICAGCLQHLCALNPSLVCDAVYTGNDLYVKLRFCSRNLLCIPLDVPLAGLLVGEESKCFILAHVVLYDPEPRSGRCARDFFLKV